MSDHYSETIKFSENGIRMAVLEPDGRVTHHDNCDLDVFGGVLPAVGDYFTTLWDPERPEPAESYLVLERHWIGELRGDNCWWLLLEASDPSPTHRRLFKIARDQSSETRGHQWRQQQHSPQEELRKLLDARKAAEKVGKPPRARKSPRVAPSSK